MSDTLILARTVWGEARGEPWIGMVAVAWVIRNRVEADIHDDGKPDWWGEGYPGVCLAPRQFSCWDDHATIGEQTPRTMPIPYAAAAAVMADDERDPTNGATHYHTIARPSWAPIWPPDWAATMRETARIGRHVFYR